MYLSVVYEVFNAAAEAASSDVRWICHAVVGTTAELERGADAEVAAFTGSLALCLARTSIFCRRLRRVALRDGGSVAAVHDQPHLLQNVTSTDTIRYDTT